MCNQLLTVQLVRLVQCIIVYTFNSVVHRVLYILYTVHTQYCVLSKCMCVQCYYTQVA